MADETDGTAPPEPSKVTRLPVQRMRAQLRPLHQSSEGLEARLSKARQILNPDASLPPCPYTPLGYDGTSCWVIQASGHVKGLASRDMQRNGMVMICSDAQWLERRYPRMRDGRPVNGFQNDQAVNDLIQVCNLMGFWTADDHVRAAGVWPGEEPGETILHRGDILFIRGKPAALGRYADHVYIPDKALPPIPLAIYNGELKATEQAGSELLARLDTFSFARGSFDSYILFGAICCAMIGGALKFRPHAWMLGELGTGKTYLQELIAYTLGRFGAVSVTNATPAGLWQSIQCRSLPICYDEAETEAGSSKIEDVVAVARQATTGGHILRGSSSHQSASFAVVSCFLMSSINPPRFAPQDASRFACVELTRNEDTNRAPIDMDRMVAIGIALQWRLTQRFDYFLKIAQPQFKQALREAGASDRIADLYSHIFASAAVALHDNVDHVAFAAQIQGHQMQRLLAQAHLDQQPGYQRCLDYLMTTRIDRVRVDSPTYGQLFERAGLGLLRAEARSLQPALFDAQGEEVIPDNFDGEATIARDRLLQFGIRVGIERPENGDPFAALVIANQHRALADVFQGTLWGSAPESTTSGWAEILRRIPGAFPSANKRRFGSVFVRATIIPLAEVIRPRPDPGARQQQDGEEDRRAAFH